MVVSPVKEDSSVQVMTISSILSSDTLSESKLHQILTAAKQPSFFIGSFILKPVNVLLTLRSSLGMSEFPEEDEGGLSDSVSCDNMSVSLKEMELRDVKGGYYEVFLAFRGYLVRELLKQM